MGNPTFFVDATNAITPRALEVPDASFTDGANWAASCAPGIGINMGEGAVVGSAEQFTLLDQDGDVREPQASQYIGGAGYVNRATVAYPGSGGVAGKGTIGIGTGTNSETGDGTPTVTGDANLETLANGWVDTPVVP